MKKVVKNREPYGYGIFPKGLDKKTKSQPFTANMLISQSFVEDVFVGSIDMFDVENLLS